VSSTLYLCTASSRTAGDFASADVERFLGSSASCFAADSSLVLRLKNCTRRSRACSLTPEVDSRSRVSSTWHRGHVLATDQTLKHSWHKMCSGWIWIGTRNQFCWKLGAMLVGAKSLLTAVGENSIWRHRIYTAYTYKLQHDACVVW
jgi:hypothetical protein